MISFYHACKPCEKPPEPALPVGASLLIGGAFWGSVAVERFVVDGSVEAFSVLVGSGPLESFLIFCILMITSAICDSK